MQEDQPLSQLKKLKQIKPRKDWVASTKSQILDQQPSESRVLRVFSFRPAVAAMVGILVLVGVFGFAQNSLPGQPLYVIKKITEKGQRIFVSQDEIPTYSLSLAEQRLNELNQISQKNLAANFSAGIKEYQEAKQKAQQDISKVVETTPKKEATQIAREIAPKLEEINKKEKEVLTSVGAEPKPQKAPAEKAIVEVLIEDAKDSSLTSDQKEDLAKVEELIEKKDYTKALETYLTSSLNK